jgi:hypothetical protein
MKKLGDMVSVTFTQLPIDEIIIDYIKNMTPKQRAFDLVEKFKFETFESEVLNQIIIGDISVKFKHYKAKECALITVEHCLLTAKYMPKTLEYWNKVKNEIEKL